MDHINYLSPYRKYADNHTREPRKRDDEKSGKTRYEKLELDAKSVLTTTIHAYSYMYSPDVQSLS